MSQLTAWEPVGSEASVHCIHVISWSLYGLYGYLSFNAPSAGSQGDFSSHIVRLEYTSLATPNSTIDYNMVSGNRAVKKVQPVLGGFKKEDYVTERQWATSKDGVQVPISIVFK